MNREPTPEQIAQSFEPLLRRAQADRLWFCLPKSHGPIWLRSIELKDLLDKGVRLPPADLWKLSPPVECVREVEEQIRFYKKVKKQLIKLINSERKAGS